MHLQRFKVPAGGNCLFWSVATAYLLPAINHDEAFADKFKNLFGSEEFIEVQALLKTHNSALNFSKLNADSSPLKTLVCVQFRTKVIDTLRLPDVKNRCLKTVTIYDFKESHNEQFVTSGKLLTELRSNFLEENMEDIDFSRVKDEEAVFKMMSSVFEAIENDDKQLFLYDFYLQCMMENTSSWGGHHEILAMSYMLQCDIEVETASATNVIKWNDSDCNLHLFYDGSHYDFGLEIGSNALSLEEEMMDTSPPINNLNPWKRKAADFNDEHENKKRSCYSPDVFHRNEEYEASGLKHSFHGVLYQLKLLILVLSRALESNLCFRLATEMDAAEKFDDLVFFFRDENDEISCIFLQAKHKQNERETITYNDLLNQEDGEFSLKKYFNSYLKMKTSPDLEKYNIKTHHFIIITNIDFDEKTVKLKDILRTIYASDKNNMLNIKCETPKKTPKQYRINPDKQIKEILKESSQLHQLAKELVVHVFNNPPKDLNLRTPIFKKFHKALCKYVLDKDGKKFQDNFMNNKDLSKQSQTLREIIYNLLTKRKNFKIQNEAQLEQTLKGTNLLFSATFGSEKAEGESELPSDVISEADIDDFFQKLVFVVDQANEEELGKTIEKEVGLTFNLSCSKDIADQIQRDLMDWFKQKQGVFITPETGKAYFIQAQNVLYNRIGIGICAKYDNVLCSLSKVVEFNDLDHFSTLLNADNSCYVIKSDEPLLTLVKIHKCKDRYYQTKDSYVILDLSDLLDIEEYVLNVFGALNSNQLLVINCDYTDIKLRKKNTDIRILIDRLYEVLLNKNRKLLVFIQKETNIEALIKYQFTLESDKTIFDDLSSNSQTMLLDKTINFQGNLIKLGDLSEDKNQWNEILDGQMIAELITHEQLEIGSAPLKLSQLEAAFAKRYKEIEPKNLLSALKLDSKEPETEIFLFSEIIQNKANYIGRFIELFNITLALHISLLQNSANIFKRNLDIDYTNCKKINIVLNEKEETNIEIFKKICYYNSEKFIYWLEIVNGKFHWLQVYDPQFYIKRQFIHSNNKKLIQLDSVLLVNEEELANADERVVLIVAEPGMGKTTTLTRLSEYKLKDSWVIRLNLKDYEEQILSLPHGYSDLKTANESIVTFFCHANQSQLSLKLIKYSLNNKMKRLSLVLFDGYDEISNDCQKKINLLIEYLKEKTHAKLWINSRKEHTRDLEMKLGVHSISFKELLSEERKEYLRNFFQVRLKLLLSESDLDLVFRKDSGKFDLFFKSLLEKVDNVFNKTISQFMGIPLQLRLLAEGFLPEFEELIQLNTNTFEKTHEFANSDLIHFYQRFIRVKYDIYFQEKTRLSLGLNSESKRWLSADLNRMHQRVALKLLFPSKIKFLITGKIKPPFKNHQFELDSRQKKELSRVGILYVDKFEERLEFIHRTFAEYFVAKFILKKLIKPLNPQLREAIQKLLFNLLQNHAQVIPMFLNELITEPDLSVRKVVSLDKCLLNEYTNLLDFAKLTELILTFSKNKIWNLKCLNFHSILYQTLHSKNNSELLNCLLSITKIHYDVICKYLLNYKSIFYNIALNSAKKSNVCIIMNVIKCYPKIIEKLTKYYYPDDLCELFQNDKELCQLIRKLNIDNTLISKMTSYEVEANELLRSFENDQYRIEMKRIGKKFNGSLPLDCDEQITIFKPYYIQYDLENSLKKIDEKMFKLVENVNTFNPISLSKEDEMLNKELLIKYQQIKEKLLILNYEKNKNSSKVQNLVGDGVNVNDTLIRATKFVKNGNYKEAMGKLKALTHVNTDDFQLKFLIIETFQQILGKSIKDKQKTFVAFLFELFSNDPIIIFNVFYFAFNVYPEFTQILVDSVQCRETKELSLHLVRSLKTSLSDYEINKFGRDLLSAIENEDNEVMKEIIDSVEHNSDGIMSWMKEQLNQNNSKMVLKNFLAFLAEYGEFNLNKTNKKDNWLFIQQLNSCLKMFPKIYKFLIFNANSLKALTFKNGSPEMFCFISEFICNEFPNTACCWAILVDKHFNTPFSYALQNNAIAAIILLFNIFNPYPTILKRLILTQYITIYLNYKNCLYYAIVESKAETLEVLLSQLSRNTDVMEYVLDHFVSNEEEKLKLYKAAVKKNPDSLLIFLNRFKFDFKTALKSFFLPDNKSVKPAFYLAGERGCKEVMDVLLRVLKNKEDVLWQLLIWTDPDSEKTVLHRAAERGYREIVDAILSSHRKQPHMLIKLILVKDKLSHTPLDCAILSERQIIRNDFNIELRRKLIASDDYMVLRENFVNGNSIQCLLNLSTDLRNIPMVVNLILVFAKSFNKVELMIAMFENEELSSALENMNMTKDEYSYNLYYSAIERDSLELVNELIKKGYDVNCTNGYGYTPLMKAIEKYKPHLEFCAYSEPLKEPDIIEALLNAGADIYFCNMNGESAYSKVINSKNATIYNIFQSK